MKKLRVISFTLIISLLLGSMCITSFAFDEKNTNPTIYIESAEVEAGETITIPVYIQNNPGISAAILSIDFDETALILNGVEFNNEFGGDFTYSKKVVWISRTDVSTSGLFMTLTFTVKDDASGGNKLVSVSYLEGDVCNQNEEDVTFVVESGNVWVDDEEGIVVPTVKVANQSVISGNIVAVPVKFARNPGISAFNLKLNYDKSIMKLVDVKLSDSIGGTLCYGTNIVWSNNTNVKTKSDFFTLYFEVDSSIETCTTAINFELGLDDICNINEESIAFETLSGTISIGHPTISVESAFVQEGNTVNVDVIISNNIGIASFAFPIIYDHSALCLESVIFNEEFGGEFVYYNNAVWYSSENSTYNGTLFTLSFSVVEGAKLGDTEVFPMLFTGDICDILENDIIFTVEAGIITIAASDEILLGDVNLDGKINAIDSNLMSKIITGSYSVDDNSTKTSDMNGDGKINAVDANKLKIVISGN